MKYGKWIKKVKEWFETPEIGISGYPRRDIETHRSIASDLSIFGGLMGLGLTCWYLVIGGPTYTALDMVLITAGIAIIGFFNSFANNNRVDALRWENQLLEKRIEELDRELGGGME